MIYRGRQVVSSAIAWRTAPMLFGFIAAAGFPTAAIAGGTIAGTTIDNIATATYDGPSGATTVTSNKVTLKVDELIDVTVAWADPGDVGAAPGATGKILSFKLTNAGNGSEGFTLSTQDVLAGDDFDPSVTSIVIDANGNGAYDAGVDTAYVAGTNDPVLAPDGSVSVFVISKIPASAQDSNRGKANLKAVAKTGTGKPGTSFAGAGQGGGDAVVGATGATANADGWYKISASSLSFVKSAVVADPFGGSNPVPGGTITYTLVATVSGSASLPNVKISDPIPSGTTFTAGSITLDGTALTDADDSDAGSFTGSGVAVGLGTIAAGASRTITFKVKIN